jgi:hypothetical protein
MQEKIYNLISPVTLGVLSSIFQILIQNALLAIQTANFVQMNQ